MAEPEGWNKHPSGQTQVFPVTGWQTGRAMKGKAGVLRVEYATEPKFEKRDARQLIFTTSQLRALADTLTKLADKLDAEAAEPKH